LNDPNVIAYLALLLWPVVVFALFERLPAHLAGTWSILGGALLLPANFWVDPPILPGIGKEEVTALSALAAGYYYAPARMRAARPFRGYDWFAIAGLVGALATTLSNSQPIHIGIVVRPGETLYDFVSTAFTLLTRWWMPFFLGRALIRSFDELRDAIRALAIAGLLYSLFIWVEVMTGPQFSWWIYGYLASDFWQSVRPGGGFRPMVFMRHGLNVALFVVLSTMAMAAMARMRERLFGLPCTWWTGYMLVVLVACQSTAALLYGFTMVPLLLLGSPGMAWRAALAVACIEIAYPLIRALDLLPVDAIVAAAKEYANAERAHSLGFRLQTEAEVLQRAWPRLWLGWGGYQRGNVWDPQTGAVVSVIDGFWVLKISNHGLIGFATVFGMLLSPLLAVGRSLRRAATRRDRLMLGFLALFTVQYVFDLIPNSSLHVYATWFVGVLAGTGRMARAAAAGPRTRREPVAKAGAAPASRPPEARPAPAGEPRPGRLSDLLGR